MYKASDYPLSHNGDWRKEKYPILFEPKDEKDGWDGSRDEEFWMVVRELKKYYDSTNQVYDFSDVAFADFVYSLDYSLDKKIDTSKDIDFWFNGEDRIFKKQCFFVKAYFKRCSFADLIFEEEVFFVEATFSGDADLYRTVFAKKANFSNASFFGVTNFIGSRFKGDASFLCCAFACSESRFSEVKFEKIANFSVTYFNCTYSLSHSEINHFYAANTQFKKVIFDSVYLEKAYFSSKTVFEKLYLNNAMFEEVHFNGAQIEKADRDTFRFVKHSYDQVGDYIRANEYYSREMDEYAKELARESWTTHFEDKAVFYLSKWISNFSQSWLLPFFWIIVWSIFLYLFQSIHNDKYFIWQLSFNEFFGFTNPLSQECSKDSNFVCGWWVLHKVGLSILVYHLVVALRRQTKR